MSDKKHPRLPYLTAAVLLCALLAGCGTAANPAAGSLSPETKAPFSQAAKPPAVTSNPALEEDIEESRYEFQLQPEAGGKMLYVTIETEPYKDDDNQYEKHDLVISFYSDPERTVPYQQIHSKAIAYYIIDVEIEDVDFDGDLDFYWPTSKGAANWNYCYWIYDGDGQEYIPDPYGLCDLISPVFDDEKKKVESHYTINWQAGFTNYYRYSSGSLVPVRSISFNLPDSNTGKQTLTVEDYEDGQWKEVCCVLVSPDEENSQEKYDQVLRWKDLDYHGSQ